MNSTESGSEFIVNSVSKSSRPGRSSIVIALPASPENEKLCVHSTLSHYINRQSDSHLIHQKLFISYGTPYKAVSSTSTLSRWLKDMLSIAGIDTSIFKVPLRRKFVGLFPSNSVAELVSRCVYIYLEN